MNGITAATSSLTATGRTPIPMEYEATSESHAAESISQKNPIT